MIARRPILATLAWLCAPVGGLVFFTVPAAAAPEAPVTSSPAKAITATSATLEGTLNPGASAKAGWYFVYSTEFSCLIGPATTPLEAEVEGEALPEHVEVTGLQPSKAYTFCMVATNEAGEATPSSNEVSFTTLAVPPTVDSESTSGVNSTSATLEAQVNPNNQATTYSFEYATNEALTGAATVAGASPLSGFGDQTASVPTGAVLQAGTTYYYRVLAKNAANEETVGKVERFTTVPTPNTDPVTAITATTATFNGHLTLNPVDTQYSFDYNAGGECTGGSATPTADAGTGAGNAAQATEVTGLLPHTQYTVCLLTSNAFGSQQGPPVSFTTLVAQPTVEDESVTNVSGESASLDAQVNPGGGETTYHFQYGTTESYGQSTPESASIGSDDTGHPALAHIQGLQAAATYHYRIVASNSQSPVGGTPGPDQTFTTQPAGGEFALPDGREWELVSPADKLGASYEPIGDFPIQASPEGDAITYQANSPIVRNPPDSVVLYTQVLSTRGSSGWSSQDISPPTEEAVAVGGHGGHEYSVFSSDLSLALIEPFTETPLSPGASGPTAYLRENATGNFFALEKRPEAWSYITSTPDFGHILLRGSEGITEWSAGQARPVAFPCAGIGTGGVNPIPPAIHAISTDGSRVVCGAAGEHIDLHDTVSGETIQLDVPEPGCPSCGGGGGGVNPGLQGASSDDSRIFFTDPQNLTVNSSAASGEDLYEFTVTSGPGEKLAGRLADLTVPLNSGEAAGVRLPNGVNGQKEVFVSEDGSYVYFIAMGQLAPGATPGGLNLYVSHDETTTFIATLAPGDIKGRFGVSDSGQNASLQHVVPSVSPNGRYLAFMSEQELTGYDNVDVDPEAKGAHDEEVFLYDAQTNHLVCVSCNPTGARPHGLQDSGAYGETAAPLVDHAETWSGHWLAGVIPGWSGLGSEVALYHSRYLSDEGRLFFESPDALAPQATNAKMSVYEYEPEGVGSCERTSATFNEKSGGCVGLISSGTSGEEAAFLDASENGDDVFFLSEGKLTSTNVEGINVYDAHVCSAAAPCAAAAISPPPCATAESCRAAPSAQPAIFGASGSATLSGAGNIPPVSASPKSKAKSLTRAQKLARALQACRRKKGRKRAVCERRARQSYGTKSKATSRKGGK